MSRRTAEASKAIAAAWENEQKRINDGKGTRDWTPEQQQDILERGKAYDENGKAFEGQHMRSVAEHPECQGDSDNIQFLTRDEHLEAHDGDWRNPSNWYYDPVTKTKFDFGEGPVIPCPVMDLSQPIRDPSVTAEKVEDDVPKEAVPKEPNVPRAPPVQERSHGQSTPRPQRPLPPPNRWERFWSGVKIAKAAAVDYVKEHKAGIIIGGLTLLSKGVVDAISNSHNGGSLHKNDSNSNVDFTHVSTDGTDSPVASNLRPDTNRNYPESHVSPQEHMVPAHRQRYHTSDGIIWKEKDPYSRGGNHSDE